ncbi:hypothetical protein GCM10010297_56120 [Streptomyces malachitofuscus]|nr:hypothetical protein GCM10010297_56120 [Streptomyces malachitofuscus]
MQQVSSVPEAFWNEIRGRNERLPVWLPGTPMELGDVGRFTGSGWTKFTTLESLGVSARPEPEGTMGDFEYASHDGVRRTGALSGTAETAVAAGRGAVTYSFERAGSFVLRATGATVHRLADLLDVEEAVLELYRRKKWKRDWVVVTEVVMSGPSLVLVSAGSKAGVTVRMSGDTAVVPGAPGVAGAAARARFAVEEPSNMAASFDGPERTALLWRGFHVSDPLFRKPRFAERGDGDGPGAGQEGGGLADGAGPSQEPYCEEVGHLLDLAEAGG